MSVIGMLVTNYLIVKVDLYIKVLYSIYTDFILKLNTLMYVAAFAVGIAFGMHFKSVTFFTNSPGILSKCQFTVLLPLATAAPGFTA